MNAIIATEKRKRLWSEDVEVPLIVGTGAFGNGKTMFGLSICPGPETLVYDNECSSLSYISIGFDHVDMAASLRQAYGEKFTAQQRYQWWKEDTIRRGKTGKYRVLVVDPASELEEGLADYIKTHVSEFGLSADQVQKSSGLFWGAMKSEWKKTLDMLRTYFETIYLTVHLRTKYNGNVPTSELEPKGKETLFELASLFLWFEKIEGTACPAANVLKSRLSKFTYVNGEFTPVAILPPRLPRATPHAIREYIAKPVDYAKLSKKEKVQEHTLSDDQKLQLQATIATAENERATTELTRLQLMQEAARKQAELTASSPVSPDMSAAHAKSTAEKTAARVAPITEGTLRQIGDLVTSLFETPEQRGEFLQPRCQEAGVERVSMMTETKAIGVLSELLAIKAARAQDGLKDRGAELLATSQVGSTPPADVPFVPDPPGAVSGQPIVEVPPPTPEQIAEFQRLVPLAFDPALVGAQCPALILKHGQPRAMLLTPSQCAGLLAELKLLAEARANAAGQSVALITPEQMERLKRVAGATGWSPDQQQAWLKAHKVDNFTKATAADIDTLLEKLLEVELGFKGGMPGN